MAQITREINPSQESINDFVDLGNGIIAHRYSIIGTACVAYAVYQKSVNPWPQYSSVLGQHDLYPDCWLADITSRRLPADIDSIPVDLEERYEAIHLFHLHLERVAESYIRQAFPQDFEVRYTPESTYDAVEHAPLSYRGWMRRKYDYLAEHPAKHSLYHAYVVVLGALNDSMTEEAREYLRARLGRGNEEADQIYRHALSELDEEQKERERRVKENKCR
jgi:hypothetical protein